MNLEKAIKTIKNLKSLRWFSYAGDRGKKILSDEEDEAIDTVLTALDERYNKGYQDGFKQAKFDCEMDHFADDRKMAEHFREDTKMIEPTDNTKIEELDVQALLSAFDSLDSFRMKLAYNKAFTKINEVINKVNAQTTVVLSHEKDIEDIKNDLDY